MLTVIFPNQSEPVFSFSRVKVWVRWSDPQMCWWNAFNLIRGSNCRSGLISISWSAVWSPLVKRARRQLDIAESLEAVLPATNILTYWHICAWLTGWHRDRAVAGGREKKVRKGVWWISRETWPCQGRVGHTDIWVFSRRTQLVCLVICTARNEASDCVTQMSERFLAVHSSSVS